VGVGGPQNAIRIGFENGQLEHPNGRVVAEVAELRVTPSELALMDLVFEDHAVVSAVYFAMPEANVRVKIAQPWVNPGSREASLSLEGAFPKLDPQPRASCADRAGAKASI